MHDDPALHWRPQPRLWEKLKPLARQMRHTPTRAEDAVWQIVRRNQIVGVPIRRQHAIERFIVDSTAIQHG